MSWCFRVSLIPTAFRMQFSPLHNSLSPSVNKSNHISNSFVFMVLRDSGALQPPPSISWSSTHSSPPSSRALPYQPHPWFTVVLLHCTRSWKHTSPKPYNILPSYVNWTGILSLGFSHLNQISCIDKASQLSYCSWQDPRAMFRHSQVVQVNFDI